MGVGVEVPLAKLDEPAERAQAIHRLDHGFASKRIQNDIDAFTAGGLNTPSAKASVRELNTAAARDLEAGPFFTARRRNNVAPQW